MFSVFYNWFDRPSNISIVLLFVFLCVFVVCLFFWCVFFFKLQCLGNQPAMRSEMQGEFVLGIVLLEPTSHLFLIRSDNILHGYAEIIDFLFL